MSSTTTATATKKRKSDGASGASKKARVTDENAAARALVSTILKDTEGYEAPSDAREALVELAIYARSLEQAANKGGDASTKVAKTPEQIEAAAEKIRRAAASGIKKQMTWKPSCKQGSAKFSYDGVCPDPEVFGVAIGPGKAPTWKMKKINKDELQDALGSLQASVRYDTLWITGTDVTVRYSPDEGTFKISGTYGK